MSDSPLLKTVADDHFYSMAILYVHFAQGQVKDT